MLHMKYPPNWQGALAKTGNICALFDKSQYLRNIEAKFKENKTELLYVYTFVISKNIMIEPKLYCQDMSTLLDGKEVLDFTLDDYPRQKFSTICIQCKNLHLYVLDFEKG
jgi:hypothetical protein